MFKKLYPPYGTNVNGGILITEERTEHRYSSAFVVSDNRTP